MKLTRHVIMLAAVAAGLTSCSDENPWASESGTGGVKLHLTADNSVIDARPQTRADGFETPSAEDFSIKLEKIDGSYSKTWATLADFESENSFPTGAYTLTAFYGTQEDEGFEMPYFEGSTQLTVLEQRLTETDITASLANSMVSIDYTDAFKKYFSDYKTTVHSEGHSYVEIAKDETRPAFIAPGNVDITVEFTKPNGKSAKVQPANFAALAKHHYHITLDVNNGNVGEAQLTIVFDETITQEDVVIDLTDDLFSSAAPRINPSGFNNGETLELLSYTAPENPLKFTVIAHGGLSEAVLTIASSDYTPAFGKEINLIAATEAQQQQIAEAGIKVVGLFKNPDRMASVDISGLIERLPAGNYEISMMAKDRFTRVSDPVSVKFTSVPLELSIEPAMGLYGVKEATFDVSYNGSNPKADISFQAMNRNGVYMNAPITEVTEVTRTRSIPSRDYRITIQLPDADRDEMPVKVFIRNNEVATTKVLITEPEFALTADAFSTYTVVKVTADDAVKSIVTNNLHLFLDNAGIEASRVERKAESGYIYIKGLTPGQAYLIEGSLTSDKSNAKSMNITTENAQSLVNGDFSDTHQTINHDIQVGGPYKAGAITYTNWVKVTASEPTGWATLNPLTFYTGSSAINSWFTVPSAYMENGVAVVRSVGYDHAGIVPKETGGFLNTDYYNTTVPTIASKTAGELFLGSYSYDGTPLRTDGIDFSCRPLSVSFDYSYTPTGNENGLAVIEMIGADGTVVGRATRLLDACNAMTGVTVAIPNYAFGKKATKIRLSFKSSSGEVNLTNPSGSGLKEWSGTLGGKKHWLDENKYKTFASGSVLKIDNVKLNY